MVIYIVVRREAFIKMNDEIIGVFDDYLKALEVYRKLYG